MSTGVVYVLQFGCCSVDVKNAYLKVPQQEVMYVMIPGWVRNLNPESDCNAWLLKKCLPGRANEMEHFVGSSASKTDVRQQDSHPTLEAQQS